MEHVEVGLLHLRRRQLIGGVEEGDDRGEAAQALDLAAERLHGDLLGGVSPDGPGLPGVAAADPSARNGIDIMSCQREE